MNINPQLKKLWRLAFPILAIILIIINIAVWVHPHNQLKNVSYASQIKAANRLKRPNVDHASSIGGYPRLTKRGQLKVIVLSQEHLLYITNKSKVLYACHATVDLPSINNQVINGSYGQQNVHVIHGQENVAVNWTSFGSHYYIEAPESIAGQKVHGNWVNRNIRLPNTILVSRSDARFLQHLPSGSKVIVK